MKRLLFLALCLFAAVPVCAAPAVVQLVRTPGDGIQPQAVVAGGVLHLLYFKGDPAGGDLFYVHRPVSRPAPFSRPVRVNSQSGSAIAMGTIRGGQIAVGKNGRVHVAWNGSKAGMLYARLNDARTAFERQKDVATWANRMDGGGSVAADKVGNVYVVWHSRPDEGDEAGRAIYLARSTDDGQTFARETRVNPTDTGACGCCSLRAFVDKSGTLQILYRAATANVERTTTWLRASGGGKFQLTALHPWRVNVCPMSSYTLTDGAAGLLGAWETQGQIFRASLSAAPRPIAAPGVGGDRKHPVMVENAAGQTLLAWTEGTGWQRGGALAWQVYGKNGQPVGAMGRAPSVVPVWSLPTAYANPDGSFAIVH